MCTAGFAMKKGKKLLVLGLVLAYMCMATACTNNDKNSGNSGSLAGSGTQNETGSSAADTNTNDAGDSTMNDENTADTANGTDNAVNDGNETNAGDGNGSVLDDAGNAVGDMVEDAADGVSDITNDLVGDGDNNTTTATTAAP